MQNKLYYVIFKITSLGQQRERCYLGKQITYLPRDKYFGEDQCLALAIAIRKCGKHRFKKEVVMLCENEEQMNAEYSRMVDEILAKYTWKYYNKQAEKKTRKRSEITIKRQKETITKRYASGELKCWNKGIVRYYSHAEEFKARKSEEYRGENNPNYRHGRHVKSD